MKVMSKTVATVVAVLLSLALPLSAAANPGIVVVPDEHHFGDVELKTPVTIDITVISDWMGVLFIEDILMVENSSPDFTFALPPTYDGTIPPFGELVIKVTYSPSAPGFAAAVLAIEWTNGHQGTNYVQLDGTGIEPPGGPPTIQDILDFFDEGVETGTIEGRGHRPGQKRAHLKIFAARLILAAIFLEHGWMRGACKLLERSYAFSDDQNGPRDLIEGEAVLELNNMILELMTDLGCL